MNYRDKDGEEEREQSMAWLSSISDQQGSNCLKRKAALSLSTYAPEPASAPKNTECALETQLAPTMTTDPEASRWKSVGKVRVLRERLHGRL